MKRLIILLPLFAMALSLKGGTDEEKLNELRAKFASDTARIERKIRTTKAEYPEPYTTRCLMADSVREAEYDRLLNRYYRILMKELDDDSKAALKASQLAWIVWRDKEKAAVGTMHSEFYDRSGWKMYISYFHEAEITKQRAIKLYVYADSLYEAKEGQSMRGGRLSDSD